MCDFLLMFLLQPVREGKLKIESQKIEMKNNDDNEKMEKMERDESANKVTMMTGKKRMRVQHTLPYNECHGIIFLSISLDNQPPTHIHYTFA